MKEENNKSKGSAKTTKDTKNKKDTKDVKTTKDTKNVKHKNDVKTNKGTNNAKSKDNVKVSKDAKSAKSNNVKVNKDVKSTKSNNEKVNKDAKNMKSKKKKKNKRKKLIIIMALLLIVFGAILTFMALHYFNDNDSKETPIPVKVEKKEVDPKYEKLKELNKKNSDVVGWISIKNTIVNYPVLHSDDDYYLDHNYNKKYQREGSIFIDKHNNIDDVNLIIHGHNMGNGKMFHTLINYKKESYYKKHKTIDYYTLDGHKTYQIVAVFLSQVYEKDADVFKYYKFYGKKSEDYYNMYIKNVKELALYDTGIDARYPTKLISLSTCEYTNDNGRLVVVAKEV